MPEERKELTVPFLLRELANNIEIDKFYGIRIGWSVLLFQNDGYEVIDWDYHHTHHKDLFDAIGKFIEVNKR